MLSQDDLARGNAVSAIRRNSLDIPIDNRIAGGGGIHQTACIDVLCGDSVLNQSSTVTSLPEAR